MKILIGSRALARYVDSIEPNDTDYFSDKSIPGAECFYHPDLEKYDWHGDVANLDELYTIKVSHSFWCLRNGSWSKHIQHISLMEEMGAKLIPELYSILYSIWEERYGKKKVNLNAEPEEFFNNRVKRAYEHDSVHAAIAFGEEPLFNKILRDGHKVAVDKNKFDSLSHEDKIHLVQEELFATALERKVIDDEGKFWRSSYQWALMMLITSFSKGWFPLWVVTHINEIKNPPFNYYDLMMKNSHKLIPKEN